MAGIFQAKKAVRTKRPLKVSMEGISGAGKTYTALRLAFDMRRAGIGSRIIVIDSENESAGLYAGETVDGERWDYDTMNMPQEARVPAGYADAYSWAVGEGYDIVIIDSLSHAWHGALEQVDRFGKNKLEGWASVTPQQRQMMDAITDPRAHCIATMRVKSEWADVEKANGKTSKQKVGMKSDQRDNTEYEFDLVLRFEQNNDCRVEKVRGCSAMNGRHAVAPTPKFWQPLIEWWKSGAPAGAIASPAPEPATSTLDPAAAVALREQLRKIATEAEWKAAGQAVAAAKAAGKLTEMQVTEFRGTMIAARPEKPAPVPPVNHAPSPRAAEAAKPAEWEPGYQPEAGEVAGADLSSDEVF